MPATFIVLMSFTSLVLDRSAAAARVSLGVTTVLTITTVMHSAKANLPHTSYPKVNLKLHVICCLTVLKINTEILMEAKYNLILIILLGNRNISRRMLSVQLHNIIRIFGYKLLRKKTI